MNAKQSKEEQWGEYRWVGRLLPFDAFVCVWLPGCWDNDVLVRASLTWGFSVAVASTGHSTHTYQLHPSKHPRPPAPQPLPAPSPNATRTRTPSTAASPTPFVIVITTYLANAILHHVRQSQRRGPPSEWRRKKPPTPRRQRRSRIHSRTESSRHPDKTMWANGLLRNSGLGGCEDDMQRNRDKEGLPQVESADASG